MIVSILEFQFWTETFFWAKSCDFINHQEFWTLDSCSREVYEQEHALFYLKSALDWELHFEGRWRTFVCFFFFVFSVLIHLCLKFLYFLCFSSILICFVFFFLSFDLFLGWLNWVSLNWVNPFGLTQPKKKDKRKIYTYNNKKTKKNLFFSF